MLLDGLGMALSTIVKFPYLRFNIIDNCLVALNDLLNLVNFGSRRGIVCVEMARKG